MRKAACTPRRCRSGTAVGICLVLWLAGAWLREARPGWAATSPLGAAPGAGLVWGNDGLTYGTTRTGGEGSAGTVFKLNPDGSSFELLHSFGGGSGGFGPDCTLVMGWDGKWYGTTTSGGLGCGLVFSLAPGTADFSVLYTFSGQDGDGAYPSASLVQGSDGTLYGVCHSGGDTGVGTVYKLNPDGTGYQVLHSFSVVDGAWPRAPLAFGWDGALYGTCYSGGASNLGVIFKLNTDGTNYMVLHHFAVDTGDGASPFSALLQGWDWGLYGTTSAGGSNNAGTAFKLDIDGGNYTILHHFARGRTDGTCPYTTLVQGWDWGLYGTTLQGGSSNAGTVYRMDIDGQRYAVIHHFGQNATDGVGPYSTLVQGTDLKMYGTTLQGGSNNVGTVFRLNVDGSDYRVLHSFVVTNTDPGPEISVSAPQVGALQVLPDRNFRFTMTGMVNLAWRVQATSSLAPPIAWQDVARLLNIDGTVQFTDINATNYSRRYYRVVWP